MLAHGIRRTIGSSGSSGHWAVEYRNSDAYTATCSSVGYLNSVYVGLLTGTTVGIAKINSAGLPEGAFTYVLGGGAGTRINDMDASGSGVVLAGTFLPSGNTKTESLYGSITSSNDLDYRTLSEDTTYLYEGKAVTNVTGVEAYVAGVKEGTRSVFMVTEATGVATSDQVGLTGISDIQSLSSSSSSRSFFGGSISVSGYGALGDYDGGVTYVLNAFDWSGGGGSGSRIIKELEAIDTTSTFGLAQWSVGGLTQVFKSTVSTPAWSRQVGTTSHRGRGLAKDSSGNVYVLLSASNAAYIAKYNSSGAYQSGWSIVLAGTTSLTVPDHNLSMTSDDRMVFSLTADNTPSDDSTWVFCLPTDGTGLGAYGDVTFASSSVADAPGNFSYITGYSTSKVGESSSDTVATSTGTSQDLTPITTGL